MPEQKKLYRVIVDFPGLRLTDTGMQKIWYSHLEITHCCALDRAVFIWERSTKHNGYTPYSTYIHPNHVKISPTTFEGVTA